MSLNLIMNGATIKRTLADRVVEQPIDTEFVLPDYCPDISRMLKCRTTAKIVSKTVNKNILTLTGNVCVSVIYLDSDCKGVRSYSSSIGFSKECELDEDAENCSVFAQAGVDYLNCRAVTGRKLDLHGAVSIHYTVCCKGKTELPCKAEGDGIQTRCKTAENTAEVIIGEKNIIISEDLEISQTAQSVRSIIRHEASAVVSECKAVGNKAIIKGDLNLNILYSGTDDSSVSKFDCVIPFSQIIDVEELEIQAQTRGVLEVSSMELRSKTGLDGEAKVISVSAVIQASVISTYQENISFITDAYSTEYALKTQKKNISLRKGLNELNETFSVNKTVDFPENISSVADLWCEVKNESVKTSNEGIIISGTATAQMIAFSTENVPIYIEKPIEYTYLFKTSETDGNIGSDVSVRVLSASYTFASASSVEIRCEISACASVYRRFDAEAIVSVEIDGDVPKKEKSGASLVVYFAKAGEELWDIARCYNTGVSDIMTANSLSDETLAADIPLLLPIK